MKIASLARLLLSSMMFVFAGCANIDVTPAGNPDRVLTGTVLAGASLPAGAEVVVRLIATTGLPATKPTGDLPITTPGSTNNQVVERVLGTHSQILANGTSEPVPFQIEYYADDAMLRRGVTLDARISYEGKLRYRSINSHLVTMSASAFRQEIAVQPVAR